MQIETTMIVGAAGIGSGLLGKVLWDWIIKTTKIPRAKNGYLTLEELAIHCQSQHKVLTDYYELKVIELKEDIHEIKTMLTEIRLTKFCPMKQIIPKHNYKGGKDEGQDFP